MIALNDAPHRYALTNELHARPFPNISGAFRASHIAYSPQKGAGGDMALSHLSDLCARIGVAPPPPGAGHFTLDAGRWRLKWERHSEFVALTAIAPGEAEARPFERPPLSLLPPDWIAAIPGAVHTALHIHGETDAPNEAPIPARFAPAFMQESLCGGLASRQRVRYWTDFRIHEDGFMRFAVAAQPDVSGVTLSRFVQRLIEVETYRAFAMLGLAEVRGLWPRLNAIDAALAEATRAIGGESERQTLDSLTALSAEIEAATSAHAFRFDATRAYARIVRDRAAAISIGQIEGLASLEGFLIRRFEPAMRTCETTAERLDALSRRAERAGALLRSRIDVTLEEQNRALLQSMDARAGLQLRLQETVEGLSVVAISYYAVGLAGYLLEPLAGAVGMGPKYFKSAAAVAIIAAVWVALKRMKKRLGLHLDE